MDMRMARWRVTVVNKVMHLNLNYQKCDCGATLKGGAHPLTDSPLFSFVRSFLIFPIINLGVF